MINIFVKRGVCVPRYFQRRVNAGILVTMLNKFKFGIDFNESYFKIVGNHCISAIENKS